MSWDPRSLDSLKAHTHQLTHICPEWFTITNNSYEINGEIEEEVLNISQINKLGLIPLLTNLDGDIWRGHIVESLIISPVGTQEKFTRELIEKLEEIHATGVVIDWQGIQPSFKNAFSLFMQKIGQSLKARHLELWLCVPVGNDIASYDLPELSKSVTHFVAMLYDENGDTDLPGPIASEEWFKEWLSVLLDTTGAEQWVVGLGVFGYDWPENSPAAMIGFHDVMALANDAHVNGISVIPPLLQPHFSYSNRGQSHTVWFQDAITFHDQKKYAERSGVPHLAIYRLGSEDPHVWTVLENVEQPQALENIPSSQTLAQVGVGEFISITQESDVGQRIVWKTPTNTWQGRYLRYPQATTCYHQGGHPKNKVSITFDDGPDPGWTPLILDLLKERDIKAAFFVVGKNGASHPELVQRIINEGHEIGNHTYSHPNVARISNNQFKLELNATQRLLSTLTGHYTILFRPPYQADSRPHRVVDALPIIEAQRMGYVTVCENIDSEDWNKPDADTIYKRVVDRRREGNILLFHDGGGDRSETLKALPPVLDFLKERGDKVVALSTLIGLPRDVLMPTALPDRMSSSQVAAQAGFAAMHGLEELLWSLLVVTTLILFLRGMLVIILALYQRRKKTVPIGFFPPITILIAAYNEEKLITQTLDSVIHYQGEMEIIVVNDGSTDKTGKVVKNYAKSHSKVKVLEKANGGKALALQYGLQYVSHDIIVMLDADTCFQPNTLNELVAPFQDEKIGAVSGRARVGNTRRWITRFQALEYTCSFNLDRRAYDLWNAITVVPGAVGAFRRKAIEEAGGISTDTLAEDTDLTLCLHRMGYKVAYAASAIGWTEAPETLPALIRQRIRWAYGTLQCLWKHQQLLFNPDLPGLGFFALPHMWLQLLLVALIPLVDFMTLFSLIVGNGSAIIGYFLAFIGVDCLIAAVALMVEREPIRTAWLIIPMRLLYRPLLAWVVWKALLQALRGVWMGWGKLERRGTVVVPQ